VVDLRHGVDPESFRADDRNSDVAGQEDVRPIERDEQEAVRRPRSDSRAGCYQGWT
jgi:hypothetical protein